jgi:hypothetical protein
MPIVHGWTPAVSFTIAEDAALAFQFSRNSKFAMLALDGIYSELPDAEFQLSDGTWAMPRVPAVADLGKWKEWIGSIRAGSLERANLVLLIEEESSKPLILDDVHNRLREGLVQLFYFLHFRQGIECAGAIEPDLLCGSCTEGGPIIRQMNKLPAFRQSRGYIRAPITEDWLKESLALRSGSKVIGSAAGEFQRVIRGLNVLFSGLRETGQERLHQLVRSLEAIILPDTGKTKKQFVNRCQTFALSGAAAQLALQEIFDMRSDTEHLQDWNRAVQTYPVAEREDVCWQRTRQAERLACFAYSRVLLDMAIHGHFRTDDTLAQFWKLPDDKRHAIWGKALDITKEPRHSKFDQWGRAVVWAQRLPA